MFAIINMTTINSCAKVEEQEPATNEEQEPTANKDVKAEKTNVKTFEIINLITYEILANKYNATFGSANIELLKTSDSTLTFYVPDIAEGEVSLKFDLTTIKFKVAKTAEVNMDQFITNLNQNFDAQLSSLNPSTPEELAEINSLNQYKKEVISLFNSLTDDEKRQSVLFYEANKEIFKSFVNSTFTNLDASTTMRRQSKCPRTDYKSFYGCTAENLGDAAIGLKNASKVFLKMVGMALVMGGTALSVTGPLGPVAFGITAVGMSLPLGMAGYLLITETGPAGIHFLKSTRSFLSAPWIFRKELFQATTEVFQDQISTSLNLTPKFSSISSNDGNINSGSGYFINAMASLEPYWNKLTAIFGNFPTCKNTEEPTTLATNEISLSNISNPNVQYLGNTGQSVRFKSISGNEENFNYNIRVAKEGFVEEKILNGKVLAVTDSTAIYQAACVGWWTVKGYDPNNPTVTYSLELFSNRTGTYHTTTNTYPMIWYIKKSGNEYRLYESGFWHPAYNNLVREKLTYPLTIFKTYSNWDPNFVSQEYIKN